MIDYIEKEFFPKSYNTYREFHGIQFGFDLKNRIIKKVLITIAPTLNSLKMAFKEKINLVLSYYPLLEHPTIALRKDISQRLALLSYNRTILYIINSAFNFAENGFIDILINKLHLIKEGVFNVYNNNNQTIPIGRICSLQGFGNQTNSVTLSDLLRRIENFLNAENLRYVGDLGQKMNKICIVERISEDILSLIHKERCQCCITQDIGYKEALFAQDLNISLIETVHYAQITVFNDFCNLISLEFPYVEFSVFNFKNPFSYFHFLNQNKTELNRNDN